MGNYRFENNPVAVENAICGNEEIQSGEPCAALHTHISVGDNSKESVSFYLGAETSFSSTALTNSSIA